MKPTPTTNEMLAEAIDREAPAERIIQALAGALEADSVARDGTRSADHRSRLQAAQLLLQYRLGRPSEREPVKEAQNSQQTETLEQKLTRSPALRELYREELAKAEAAAEAAKQ